MKITDKINSYQWFVANEKELLVALKKSIKYAFKSVGDDIYCIDWFCSKAEVNIARKLRKAA